MAEFNGVVDQVIKNLLDFPQIGVDHLHIVGKCEIQNDVFGVAGSLKGGRRILDDPVDIKIAAGKEALAVQGVERQHPLGQLVEPLRFRNYDIQIFFLQLGRNGSVQHGL